MAAKSLIRPHFVTHFSAARKNVGRAQMIALWLCQHDFADFHSTMIDVHFATDRRHLADRKTDYNKVSNGVERYDVSKR